MGGVRRGVAIERFPAADRGAQVAALTEPWIGEEGPLEATFRPGGPPALLRGIAFDSRTTVVWDEDGVQVLRAAPAEDDVVALDSAVLLRDRFARDDLPVLRRIDFLRRGTLLGSLYTTEGEDDA